MSKNKRKLRNTLHDHPLLQKGGVHQKPEKAVRRQEKIKLKKEWLPKKALLAVVS